VAGPGWTGAEILDPIEIRSPDLPARNESVYKFVMKFIEQV
jgi:hypothetical protein